MINRFQPCLTGFVWRPENDGQTCHVDKGDTGGTTSWGMTYKTFSDYLRSRNLSVPPVSVFATLPRTAFMDCYKSEFWDAVQGDLLPVGLDLLVFDFAVLSSPYQAIKALQACLGVSIDGNIGTNTRAAIAQRGSAVSFANFNQRQVAYYKTCATYAAFGHGWLRRAADALTQANQDRSHIVPLS